MKSQAAIHLRVMELWTSTIRHGEYLKYLAEVSTCKLKWIDLPFALFRQRTAPKDVGGIRVSMLGQNPMISEALV